MCRHDIPSLRYSTSPIDAGLDDPRRAALSSRPVNVQETTPRMSLIEPGGIDCDIHPAVPNLKALLPYLSDHWRDIVGKRGVHEVESIAYPATSPPTPRA